METHGNRINIVGEHISQSLDYRNYSDRAGRMTRRYKSGGTMMALVCRRRQEQNQEILKEFKDLHDQL